MGSRSIALFLTCLVALAVALGVAFVAALVTAFVAVKWLLRYIQSHRFTPFAIYRIALGVVLLLWLPAGT